MTADVTWRTPTLLSLALGLACLAGCAGSGELPPDLRQLSVASIRGPGTLPVGGTFGFRSGSRVLIGDEQLDAGAIEVMVRDVISDALVQRGFRAGGGSTADLLVGYVVALEATDHASVSEAFGMDPGLLPAASGQTYDRGTLVVEFTRPGSPAPLWRGAAQAHADVTLDDGPRRARIARAVDLMFGSLSW